MFTIKPHKKFTENIGLETASRLDVRNLDTKI